MFVYLIVQVMWHAHKRPIDVNEEVFFSAPHFHLVGGGGGGLLITCIYNLNSYPY